MTYRNTLMGKSWIENYSTGEALSTICEAELHPEGYYPPSPVGAPRITQWLNLPEIARSGGPIPRVTWRPNWVDATENTDSNPFSYGCGILFINYMRFQLNIPLSDIITKAGATLAQTYQNITGRTDGWNAFNQLMEAYFPVGPAYNPLSDNVFPLPQLANMTISPDTVFAGQSALATLSLNAPHPGFAIKADLICGSPGFATLPSPPVAVIDKDQSSTTFGIATPAISVPFPPAKVFVYATSAGVTVGAVLTVQSTVNSGILKSVTLNPTVVTSGQTSQGTVTLEAPMAQDTIVGLAATETGGPFPRPGDVSSVAQVDKPSVTVRAGDTSATFAVETSAVTPHVRRTATILAHAVVTKSAQLTVEGV
jgi:hypothetical protein